MSTEESEGYAHSLLSPEERARLLPNGNPAGAGLRTDARTIVTEADRVLNSIHPDTPAHRRAIHEAHDAQSDAVTGVRIGGDIGAAFVERASYELRESREDWSTGTGQSRSEERGRDLDATTKAAEFGTATATASADVDEAEQRRRRLYPVYFDESYLAVGDRVVDARQRERVIMRDNGKRLDADAEFTSETVKLMLDTAAARGWSAVSVSGSPEFRKAVWTAGVTRGVDVGGYKTTEADQAWLEQRRAVNDKEKQTELDRSNPTAAAEAFLKASSKAERMAAATKYPQLVQAFAQEAVLKKLASQLRDDGGREVFVRRSRESIAADVAAGRELKEMALLNTKQASQQRWQERDQARNLSR